MPKEQSPIPIAFEKLGPYRVIEVIGRGGMGTVYRGVDDSTSNPVAIKVLSPNLATDPTFRERFEAEIESLKKLRQTNIVQLFGFGEESGHLFYSMELIEGASLQDELKQGRRFTWREVTRIGIQVCAALKHAHDHGIIHRDLKPANLLLDKNENVKLLDFGIAKLFGSTMVTTETVLGTADFMAPEQAEGKTAGPKTDLYSLGSVLYTLLSGKPPFSGKSVPEVVHKVRFEEPIPVGRLNLDTPEGLEELIGKLLAKNPDDRVPTALALSHRLRELNRSLSIEKTPDSSGSGSMDSLFVTDDKMDSNAGIISNRPTVALKEEQEEDDSASRDDSVSTIPKRSHFTKVARNESPTLEESPFAWGTIGKAVALLAVLLSLTFGIRQAIKPPTANRLFERISELVQDDDPRSLSIAAPAIEQFRSLYPEDERCGQLDSYIEEIELQRLQRRLERKSRRTGAKSASPVEQFYLQAVRIIHTDPDLARRQLRALVDLHDARTFSTDENTSIDASRCIALARKQLAELDVGIAAMSDEHRKFLTNRLKEAHEIEAEDIETARRIYQSVVELYHNKPWAADYVADARRQLEILNSNSP